MQIIILIKITVSLIVANYEAQHYAQKIDKACPNDIYVIYINSNKKNNPV